MSIRKTARDCANEAIAAEITLRLLDDEQHRISVSGGGRKGPFSVSVNYLSRKRMERVVRAVSEVLGETTTK